MAEFALRARAGWWGYNSHPHVSTSAARIAELGRRILPEPFFMKLIRFMDFRVEDDVFPTYHRANTCADTRSGRAPGQTLKRDGAVGARAPNILFRRTAVRRRTRGKPASAAPRRGALRCERNPGGVSKAGLATSDTAVDSVTPDWPQVQLTTVLHTQPSFSPSETLARVSSDVVSGRPRGIRPGEPPSSGFDCGYRRP